jgi:hypothetical protein
VLYDKNLRSSSRRRRRRHHLLRRNAFKISFNHNQFESVFFRIIISCVEKCQKRKLTEKKKIKKNWNRRYKSEAEH